MRHVRHLFIIVLALAAVAGLALAGQTQIPYIVNITSASCDDVSFDYVLGGESTGGADWADYTVEVDGVIVASESPISPWDDSFTVGLSLTPRPAPYVITVSVFISGWAEGSDSVSIVCGAEGPTDIAVGRICFAPGTVPATLFFDGYTIDVYAIDPSDKGELVMSFNQDYLITLPTGDTEARLLGDSDVHIPIEFYRNVNGLYRMVAGPDNEGKFFECTFGGACSHERTWIGEANRPTDEVVPVCDAPAPQPTMTPEPTPTQLPV